MSVGGYPLKAGDNVSDLDIVILSWVLVKRLHHSYTLSVKTAISLPDDIFFAVERQAKRVQKSRSQLYAEALTEYLARHAPDEVTEAMNRVVEQLDELRPDSFLTASARRVFECAEW